MEDPWYDPAVVPPAHIFESTRGQSPQGLQVLDVETRRDIDLEYLRLARDFMGLSVEAGKPQYLTDPALPLPTPQVINLLADPEERNPISLPHRHTWVAVPAVELIIAFEASLNQRALIPAGAPQEFVPGSAA